MEVPLDRTTVASPWLSVVGFARSEPWVTHGPTSASAGTPASVNAEVARTIVDTRFTDVNTVITAPHRGSGRCGGGEERATHLASPRHFRGESVRKRTWPHGKRERNGETLPGGTQYTRDETRDDKPERGRGAVVEDDREGRVAGAEEPDEPETDHVRPAGDPADQRVRRIGAARDEQDVRDEDGGQEPAGQVHHGGRALAAPDGMVDGHGVPPHSATPR